MQETRRRVLQAIADGPASGPSIAAALDVSRAAVWKHVEALRAAGFGIESRGSGYVLTDVPEFGGAAIEFGLEAPFAVEYHERIASTNDRARELAAAGASDVAVVADEQTGGRGRLNREWTAPSGGVWLSVLVRPDLPPATVPVFTLAAAVAVTEAARDRGVDAGIKWPNDVLVPADGPDSLDDGDAAGKLAGVLTEMEGEADRVAWVVVGIGVNANVDPDFLPGTATTLREHLGPVDRAAFTRDVLERFHALRSEPETVLPAWRTHAITLERRVRVETPTGAVTGRATDVEFPGTLVVETDDGPVRVSAGDCEHLRPA